MNPGNELPKIKICQAKYFVDYTPLQTKLQAICL